jgi:hypothetical protein
MFQKYIDKYFLVSKIKNKVFFLFSSKSTFLVCIKTIIWKRERGKIVSNGTTCVREGGEYGKKKKRQTSFMNEKENKDITQSGLSKEGGGIVSANADFVYQSFSSWNL